LNCLGFFGGRASSFWTLSRWEEAIGASGIGSDPTLTLGEVTEPARTERLPHFEESLTHAREFIGPREVFAVLLCIIEHQAGEVLEVHVCSPQLIHII